MATSVVSNLGNLMVSISDTPLILLCILGVGDVFYVDELLSNSHFPLKRWYELGKKLGLSKNTLDVIENNPRYDTSRSLTECLDNWLRRVDVVDSKGGATIDSLINALESMGENAVADKLSQ